MKELNEGLKFKGLVVAVLENKKTGKKRVFATKNLVVTTGEVYYAQLGAEEATTNAFGIMELGTAGTAPAAGQDRSAMTTKVTGSQKAFDATYPKTNDGDADNTGAGVGVVSYLTSYLTSEANDTAISDVIITNVTPGATEPILMHAKFGATFNKTSSDTLKVFINHTPAGV